MTGPTDDPRRPLHRDLSAFADGELDPAATRRLLRQLADDPAAADAVRQVQQLSADARHAVRRSTPAPSADLLERLRAMAPADVMPAATRRPVAWSWAARSVAAAVLLAAGVWAGHRWATAARPAGGGPSADVLPAAVVAQAEEVHGYCSRLAQGLHAGGYPAAVAALAPAVAADLHSDHPYPDLRSIGYRYRGAGPCGRPLADTAHLLYRSARPGSVDAVSVFVQPWHGQYPLDADRVYTVSVATSPFPMLAWRTDHVVYFLLADTADAERSAAALVRGTPVPTTTATTLP